MKRKILLLMMTALLSVGAWAENLWKGEATIAWSSGVFKLETASKGLSSGDVLIFTISDKTTDDGLRICEHNSENAFWAGNTLETISTQVGTIKMVVTDAIATAAGTELWVAGNGFTITSVDLERKTCVNVYTNESGYKMNYWYMLLDSQKLKYAKVGDHLRVTISAVGENTGWRKLYIQDKAEQAHENYTGNILYTCEGASLTTGKLDIWLTNDMISLIQANSLYIGGFEYTFTAVDLYHAPIELANAGDNTTTISDWNSIPTNITLADRTLTKNGDWNTLCLPFALTSSQIAASPLAGATIMKLKAEESNLDSEGTLTLVFTDASSIGIEAGMPYIVKWTSGENVSNPLFEGVTITATTPKAVVFNGGNCKFVGQFSPFPIDNSNIDEIIMLGSGNMLGYSKNARELKTFRAHFEVPTTSGARAFVMNFGDEETTGIISVQGSGSMVNGSDAWYSLGGQRLQGAPTAKGVYIQNGRKVVVK